MKLTPARKKFLTVMASTPGRLIRGLAGVVLVFTALVRGGAMLLLLAPGALLITTGIMNYCPVGPIFGQSAKSGELLKQLETYDLK